LEEGPDLVTIGNAAQVSGVYSSGDFRPLHSNKLVTSGNGDMIKLKQLELINEFSEKKDLHWKVNDSSSFFKVELERMRK